MSDGKDLVQHARGREEAIIRFLQDMVAFPSPSCQEGKVVARIVEEMERVGFDEARVDGIGNAIGRVGDGPIHLLLDAHVDTVSVADPDLWTVDPYGGLVRDGCVYGRGTADNEGAMASMVHGAALAKDLGLLDGVSLWVSGTVQEEDCDGLALQYLLENSGVPAQYVILGEATNLDVYRGHRGRCEYRIDTTGVSCHASAPSRGVNALYRASKAAVAVEQLNERLADDAFLGKGTIAATFIECLTGSYNTVPDACSVYLDRRLTVGETPESARQEVAELLPEGADVIVLPYEATSHTGMEVSQPKEFPTWTLEPEHPLCRAGVEAAADIRGDQPALSRWVFSTNGVASMGRLGIPTIGFGPGEERFAHVADERIPVDHLVKAAAFYARVSQVLASTLG